MKIYFQSIIQDSINFIQNHLRLTLTLLLLIALVRMVFDHISAPYLQQIMQLLGNNLTPTQIESLSTTAQSSLLLQIQKNSFVYLAFIFIETITLMTATLSFIDNISRTHTLSLRQYVMRFLTLLMPMTLYYVLVFIFGTVLLSLLSILLPINNLVILLLILLILFFSLLGPIILTLQKTSALQAVVESVKVTFRQLSLLIPLFILITGLHLLLRLIFGVIYPQQISLISFLFALSYNFLHSAIVLFMLISLYRVYMLQR